MDTENAPGTAAGPLSLQSQFYLLQLANSAVCIARSADAGLRCKRGLGWRQGSCVAHPMVRALAQAREVHDLV